MIAVLEETKKSWGKWGAEFVGRKAGVENRKQKTENRSQNFAERGRREIILIRAGNESVLSSLVRIRDGARLLVRPRAEGERLHNSEFCFLNSFP
jgi:hypothetical protein